MTTTAADFSIIIPSYSRPVEIRECLEAMSVLDYPRHAFEVIVVDDGSPEPLDDVVHAFRHSLTVQLIRTENSGPASARNVGAAYARGRFLAFTDDDCRPAPNWLQALHARFCETPDRMIGGRTMNRFIDNPYSMASQIIVDAAYSFHNVVPEDARFFASNNMAVPADLFRESTGFDPAFRIASEDRELCDRWRYMGCRMTYAPEVVIYHGHWLTLRRFCHQHFSYGRGAWRYHRVRSRRGSGRWKYDLPFHFRFLQLIRAPMANLGYRRTVDIAGLLILWQIANALGFFYEMFHNHSGNEEKPGDRAAHTHGASASSAT